MKIYFKNIIQSFNLLKLGIHYNFDSHFSNRANLIAGALGMFINNILYLTGMWGMLFAGRPEHQSIFIYFICLNTLVMTVWGGLNFFFGGWIDLGEIITNGQFESKLSTPRHPLLLTAFHHLHPSALGDFIMGIFGLGLCYSLGGTGVFLRTIACILIGFFSLFSIYLFSGSLAFFISRGNTLATLIRELTLSLSVYPCGKIFSTGLGRHLLLITPAATLSILPMDWIESGNPWIFIKLIAFICLFFLIALGTYRLGVRRFQTFSIIGTQD